MLIGLIAPILQIKTHEIYELGARQGLVVAVMGLKLAARYRKLHVSCHQPQFSSLGEVFVRLVMQGNVTPY